MLIADHLRVRYGPAVAVHDVSLRLGRGEIVALLGANGAGKTSTLTAIAGGLRNVTGKVTLDGESIVGMAPETIVRKGLVLVPEGRHIFATLTVGENLRLAAAASRNGGGANAAVESVLARFPVLERYFDSSAGKLSGGEQQQLALGRALASRPRLILLDEPSLGLAPVMVDVIFEAIAELRADGVPILLVEQNAQRALELADRAYVLRSGRVVLKGEAGKIRGLGTDALRDAYFGVTDG